MPDDDRSLAARVQQGNVAALAEFLVARRPQLQAFIERQLGPALRSKIEPDDLFQEMSAEAVRSLPALSLGDRDPFGWLCQIAERRIIDAHRRYFGAQKRAGAHEVPLAPPGNDTRGGPLVNLLIASMTTASQAFSRDQRHLRLLSALDSLPDEQREALRLRYVEGLPSKQIAERLGKSDGAVRVMLTRSLARLQQILGPLETP